MGRFEGYLQIMGAGDTPICCGGGGFRYLDDAKHDWKPRGAKIISTDTHGEGLMAGGGGGFGWGKRCGGCVGFYM